MAHCEINIGTTILISLVTSDIPLKSSLNDK